MEGWREGLEGRRDGGLKAWRDRGMEGWSEGWRNGGIGMEG
jgi:hypothetical protein